MTQNDSATVTRPCRYCSAAWGEETAAETCWPHPEAEVWIASGIAKAFHDAPGDAEVGWFMEDARAVREMLGREFDPHDSAEVVVTRLPDVPAGWQRFEVNGRPFVIDPNAEGFSTPDPQSAYDFIDLGWMA